MPNPKKSKCCGAPVRVSHGCDSDFGHGKKPCDCGKKGGVTSWWECEKCGKPCDVDYAGAPAPKGDWEEGFEKFIKNYLWGSDGHTAYDHPNQEEAILEIEGFIRSEKSLSKAEGREEALKKIEEWAGEMRKEIDEHGYCKNEGERWENGYDCAMIDLLHLLSKIQEKRSYA